MARPLRIEFEGGLYHVTSRGNAGTEIFIDDVDTNEVVGAGYTATGKALTTKLWTQDDTNDLAKFTADDVSWASSTITARYGILYKDTGTPGTSPVIMLIDFGSDQTTSNTEFKVTWNASGVLQSSQG